MAKQAHTWMTQAIAKFGNEPTYASGIGDLLLKYQLENEAVAHWTACVALNRQYSESRECASRLIVRMKTPAEHLAFITELLKHDTDFFGRYTQWIADDYLKAVISPISSEFSKRPACGRTNVRSAAGIWTSGWRTSGLTACERTWK